MKSPRLRSLLLAGLLAFPVIAHAHPGHDGDHDFVWDFGHFAAHPLATAACVTIVAAAGYMTWRLIRKPRSTEASRVRRDR